MCILLKEVSMMSVRIGNSVKKILVTGATDDLPEQITGDGNCVIKNAAARKSVWIPNMNT